MAHALQNAATMRFGLVLLVLVGGCGKAGPSDVIGPFTGPARRFYVSSITLPQNRGQFAVDFNGDERLDNQLGVVIQALVVNHDDNGHADEVVAARVIDATVDLVSDDVRLVEDATVGVRWNGAAGADGELSGGILHRGVLTTNAVEWTRHPPAGTVSVPVFADADPTTLPLWSWQLRMERDDDGFTGELYGVVPAEQLAAYALPAFRQMLAAHPKDHELFARGLDTNYDGQVSDEEFLTSALIRNVTAPDLHWERDGGGRSDGTKNVWSLGLAFRLKPCIDQACTRPAPAPTCHDRVRNGDEEQIDCGGACEACLR